MKYRRYQFELRGSGDFAAGELHADRDEPRRVVRRWADTFDARLHRAGLLLEQEEPPGQWRLRRSGEDRVLAATAELPIADGRLEPGAGPLAEAVAPIVGIRRLLLLADLEIDVEEIRLRDENEKIRVRCFIERPIAPATAGDWRAAPRLRVEALRGYGADAKRLARSLREAGWRRLRREWPEDLVPHLPGPGFDYRARPDARLRPADTAAVAVRTVLDAGFSIMLLNVDGIRRDVDIEFLHDFRTAGRRTRTVLSDLRDVVAPDARRHWRGVFKDLFGRTGPLRDLDVMLLELPELAAALPDEGRAQLAVFLDRLAARRERAQTELADWLAGEDFDTLRREWRAFVDGLPGDPGRGNLADAPIRDVAADAIGRLYRQVRRSALAVDTDTPFPALHELRKSGKRLRYLVEAFAGLEEPACAERLLAELRLVQDELGAMCDLDVQQHTLSSYAEECRRAGEREQGRTLLQLRQHLLQTGRSSRKKLLRRLKRLGAPAVADSVKAIIRRR